MQQRRPNAAKNKFIFKNNNNNIRESIYDQERKPTNYTRKEGFIGIHYN